MQIETERKFLIELPAEAYLTSRPSLRVMDMVQTYLTPDGQTERRLRKVTENGAVSYVYTQKHPVAGMKISRFEDERDISPAEYEQRMADCISELSKTRYAFPYHGHIIEIDVYPYEIGGEGLAGKAVLEVELSSPEETFDLPSEIRVLRELTGTREFSNKVLAKPKKAGN